ncbi:MAG: HAD family phosphatase [Pseudomonadota bacterium]
MKLANHLQAAVFDMDGLMLDTERIALGVLEQVAVELGYPWREEIGLAMVGLSYRDSGPLIVQHLGPGYPPEPLWEAFGERYLAVLDSEPIPIKPGLLELLDWLEEQGLPKAVATSTRSERAHFKLEMAGILHRFQVVVCGDHVTRGKPAPDIYLAAAKGLGIAPAQCIALEDSNPGVCAALAAGMNVIMVPDLIAASPEVIAFGHTICESLHQALHIMRQS